MRRPTIPALVATLLLLATPALASDGVLEIHQSCVATGCFPGDAAGYPVTIASSGSYRLTSNLTLPDENATGIEVTSGSVTLDLGGFEIAGPNVCTWTEPVESMGCTLLGSGRGIDAAAGTSLDVRNGRVTGVGDIGIHFYHGTLQDLEVRHTGRRAIHTFADPIRSSLVQRVRVESVGNAGISAATVLDSQVDRAGGNGIWGIVVRGNRVDQVVIDGIIGGVQATIEGNQVRRAQHWGITAFYGATIVGNSVVDVDDVGIQCGTGVPCLVTGNTVMGADNFGLVLNSQSGYGNNVIDSCNGGNSQLQVAGGHETATNVCAGDTTCP